MARLVPHGSTPTGFGVRQRSNGNLRAVSKCCGRSMQSIDAFCKGCGASFREDAKTLGVNLSGDIELTEPVQVDVAARWIERVTGYPHLSVNMDVVW